MIHVLCRTCGEWEIVGPGHPAMRDRGDGTHEIHDRALLLENCACPPDDLSGSRPLAFTFMAATATGA
jgi:hypothetical protein